MRKTELHPITKRFEVPILNRNGVHFRSIFEWSDPSKSERKKSRLGLTCHSIITLSTGPYKRAYIAAPQRLLRLPQCTSRRNSRDEPHVLRLVHCSSKIFFNRDLMNCGSSWIAAAAIHDLQRPQLAGEGKF